ncbi:MAG: hypothetical protein JXL81_12295 [Deltaproteobacteria bacterium]|nr:hypothetical protein [Deltaproteobacteria bacterium]
MRYRFIPFAISLGVCLMIQACSPGVYVKMQSSAPERSPVFIGMKRHDAEMHLGQPIFIARLKEDQYRGIYEYEVEPRAIDILSCDIMDFTTMGFGNLIISPLDRAKSSRHLVAVVYQMDDESVNNDRVVDIKERVKVSLE